MDGNYNMKITRIQLRKLISESVNEYRIRPSTGDADTDDKIRDMIDTGDQENIVQADDLASMLGYEGEESFSQAEIEYDNVELFGKYSQLLAKNGIDRLHLPDNSKLTLIDREESMGRVYDFIEFEVELPHKDTKMMIAIEFKQPLKNHVIDHPEVLVHVYDITDTGLYDFLDTFPQKLENNALSKNASSPQQLNRILKDVYNKYFDSKSQYGI